MERAELKSIIEALLFVATEPLGINQLKELVQKKGGEDDSAFVAEAPSAKEADGIRHSDREGFETGSSVVDQLRMAQARLEAEVSRGDIQEAIDELLRETNQASHGIELVFVANGYQFRSRKEMAPYLQGLLKLPKPRLSAPSMETLAIIAYQQPVERTKIEQIRGVDSDGVLRTLLDRELIRIVGRSEEPGRPLLYGTTPVFLETFGLGTLSDLPTLKDLETLESGSPVFPASESGSSMAEGGEEPAYTTLDDESAGLLEELENSVRNLKDLEKNIFTEPAPSLDESFSEKSEYRNPKSETN